MAEQDYWFARRFPVGDRRNSMSPVRPEGFRVAWTFVGWMVGGAIAWLLLGGLAGWSFYASGPGPLSWVLAVLGPVALVACAIYGGTTFIREAQRRGDPNHTVDDYKAGRVK